MKLKTVVAILLLAIVLSCTVFPLVAVAEDALDRLENELDQNKEETERIAWGVLSPALKIGKIILYDIGIILLIATIGYVVVKFFYVLRGKAQFGKKEIGIVIGCLVVGILVTGPGWVKVLKLGNSVVVKPVQTQIIEKNNTSETPTDKPNTQQQSTTQQQTTNK